MGLDRCPRIGYSGAPSACSGGDTLRNYVVFVHGIGDQARGEYQGFQERVRGAAAREARRRGHGEFPSEAIAWESVYWADITQTDQNRLKQLLGVRGLIRPFMVDSLGDAIAYSRLRGGSGKYSQIQGVFAHALKSLSQQAEDHEGPGVMAPLTVLAHSLGTVIATGTIDYLRDPQTEDSFPPNLDLRHLFTFGSPIALYGLRYGLENFNRPTQVPDWQNFYYRHDIVAYPLRPLIWSMVGFGSRHSSIHRAWVRPMERCAPRFGEQGSLAESSFPLLVLHRWPDASGHRPSAGKRVACTRS